MRKLYKPPELLSAMMARIFLGPAISLDRENSPTATEMSRVRHTITMLIRSEAAVLEKMSNTGEGADITLLSDIRHHALEIYWGWQELKRRVETLPDFFFEKTRWLEESVNGLERTTDFCEWAHQKLLGHPYTFRGIV
ncbi:hypothetical protein IH922_04525 [candidate division KSB1 bacterium]|nr:hypothetical protein [candidate division KSB1 bacterium]